MINRKFFGILIVFLVILGGIQLLQKNSHRRQTTRSSQRVIVAEALEVGDLGRVVIGRGAETEAVVLAHEPDGWVVENAFGHRVDGRKLGALINVLGGLRGEFRSDDPGVLADYGLSEDEAIRITVWRPQQSDPLCDLLVGAQPAGARGNFLRLAGSDEVCLSAGSLLNSLGIYGEPETPRVKHFLDLQAQQIDAADVDAIVLTDAGVVTTLEKDFPEPGMAEPDENGLSTPIPVDRAVFEWKLTTPVQAAALKTKVDALQNAVARINAVDIADPGADPAAYGLADAARRVDIALQNGTQAILFFGDDRPEEEGKQAGTYMQVAGDPTVWVVTDYTVTNIFKTHTELLPEE